MSGGAATLSFNSGASSGSNLVYDISRTINIGETGTVSYTQPVNGIEDASNNDLGNVTNSNVTNNSTTGQVATPVISPAAGPYFSTQSVTITDATSGSTIYYTIDGSNPTSSSSVYSAAIPVSAVTTVKAFATASGSVDSAISQSNYEIGTWVTSTSGVIYKVFSVPPQSGTFTWSFRASAAAAATDGLIALSQISSTAYTDFAVILRFNNTNTIDARNSATYAAVNTFSYAPGTTYEFVVTINVASKTYSATVAPISGTPVTIATNYAFRDSQASASQLNYFGAVALSGGPLTISQMSLGGSANIQTLNVTNLRIGP